MKDTFPLYVSIVTTLIVIATIAMVSVAFGERQERNRQYAKCVKEHDVLPHKDVLSLCTERVK